MSISYYSLVTQCVTQYYRAVGDRQIRQHIVSPPSLFHAKCAKNLLLRFAQRKVFETCGFQGEIK